MATSSPPSNRDTKVTPMYRRKVRVAWSAPPLRPAYRQQPPSFPLKVSGFRLHRDVESEFQKELGKSLFEQTIELSETKRLSGPSTGTNLTSTLSTQNSERTSSPTYCCWNKCDDKYYKTDNRRCVNVRATQCKSPLVADSKNFTTYFSAGKLDQISVARSRGSVDFPRPNIGKCVQRVKSASLTSLGQFSLKDLYFDEDTVEWERSRYWRSKVVKREEQKRLKAVEKFCFEILGDLFAGSISDQIYYKEKEQQLIHAKRIQEQQRTDWLDKVIEEVRKEAEEREAQKRLEEAARKRKKGKKSKKRPKSILKRRARSRSKSDVESDTGSGKQGKRVSFREKLTDTKTIRPFSARKKKSKKSADDDSISGDSTASSKKSSNRATSAKSNDSTSTKGKSKKKAKKFPGYATSEKVLKKKKKSKISVEPAPLPEPVIVDPNPEKNKQEELIQETIEAIPQDPVIVILDEPPDFCLASEYKTKNQIVSDWLYNGYSSAGTKTHPLI